MEGRVRFLNYNNNSGKGGVSNSERMTLYIGPHAITFQTKHSPITVN